MVSSSWSTCNTTLEDSYIHEIPLFNSITFHHLGLFLAAVFGLISIILALFLVFQHATHYLRPWEQKHIIRILLMIPIYSSVQFLSYLFYRKAVYFQVLGNCYEAFAIASFFTLLCHYVAPNLHDQKDYFRGLAPLNWVWGVFGLQKCTGGQNKGIFRKPRSGLTWFNIIWIGVFQYCFIRILFTVVSVITEELGRYCEASLSPAFAHVWVTAFEALSVTIAMFCLIQFYLQLRYDLAEHKPFLKVLCIKLVIFFSFWQTIIISLLSSGKGPLQPSAKISYQDIKVGIPAVMLCIEMAIFAVMHLFAFPWKEYVIDKHDPANMNPLAMSGAGYSGASPRYQGGLLGIKALADAFNPWDIIKASARGFRWLFVGYRKREADRSYQNAGAAAQQGKLDGLSPEYTTGPTFAGNREAATELRAGREGLGQRSTDEGDRAGLLRHSANMGGGRGPGTSPYRTEAGEEDVSGDEARTGQYHAPPRTTAAAGYESKGLDYGPTSRPTMRDAEFGDEDTGYHPGVGPASGSAAGARGSVHPAYRAEGGAAVPAPSWDPWAGAQRSDAESVRPPTYRSQDPRG
ncbi:hypothetical protein LTS00_009749 [Friedmanniomyces endolithicus]|uniref:DUF300-domain-containing protein n=2 Tax=Friedmanniomyces endolithicus TaxID=329885 RepID=A0AAN6FLX0_9PEZI|nr:hypothetical protein LTS00_009749 [Friedmanniomyces endolithicus]KAK0320817.1 hypothetical protein LTR82_008135 [Friedmanniomyces endolithicus]